MKLKFIFNFVKSNSYFWSYIEEKKKSLRNQNPVNISNLPSDSEGKLLVSNVAEAIAKATLLNEIDEVKGNQEESKI